MVKHTQAILWSHSFYSSIATKKILQSLEIIDIVSFKFFMLVKLLTWELQKICQRFSVVSQPKIFMNSIVGIIDDNRRFMAACFTLVDQKILKVFLLFQHLGDNKKLTV